MAYPCLYVQKVNVFNDLTNQITTDNGQIKDGIGGLPNFSYTGFLYHDSDIYHNHIEGVYTEDEEGLRFPAIAWIKYFFNIEEKDIKN